MGIFDWFFSKKHESLINENRLNETYKKEENYKRKIL